jgi:hypothetical protein
MRSEVRMSCCPTIEMAFDRKTARHFFLAGFLACFGGFYNNWNRKVMRLVVIPTVFLLIKLSIITMEFD